MVKVKFPDTFSVDHLQIWHSDYFKNKIDIVERTEKYQKKVIRFFVSKESLIRRSNERNCWNELFSCVDSALESKRIQNDLSKLIFVPDILPKSESIFQDNFVKSTNSVLDKYWREVRGLLKDKKKPISFGKFLRNINDFVRFSIKADTLAIAEAFSKEIVQIPKLASNPVIEKFNKMYLADVRVDHELKMASGYFAYHCYFHFKEGFIVEMQIFSELSNYWRKISHHIYEKLRDKPKEDFRFNDVESRMIAMGHLLYLADCELNKIENELGLKK